MITYVAAVVTLTFVLLVVHAVRKEWANREILGHLARAEAREQQMWDVLEVAKNHRESGRVHHKEADLAKDELGKKVDQTTAELKCKIEEVPAKVAEVIEAQKSGDSGTLKTVTRRPDGT